MQRGFLLLLHDGSINEEEEESLKELFEDAIVVRRIEDKDDALSALIEVVPMVCIYVGTAIPEGEVTAMNCEYVSPSNWCLEYQFLIQLGKRLRSGRGPLGEYRFIECGRDGATHE